MQIHLAANPLYWWPFLCFVINLANYCLTRLTEDYPDYYDCALLNLSIIERTFIKSFVINQYFT